MQTVAIITEEKLIFSLRDVTDINVYLEGWVNKNGVSSRVPAIT